MICEVCKIDFDKLTYKNKCIKCYHKQHYIDNRERRKQYHLDNKEKIKKQRKQFYENNKERLLKEKKQYDIDNKEKIKEYNKQYNIDNKEYFTIINWKKRGLIELEGVYTYQSLFEYYISITHCEVCNKKFKDSHDRCLDHCHTTNIFRWVLCQSCNNKDYWMTYF